MSETIFLEPVSPSKKIIYIDFRNTSDKELMCEEQLRNNIVARRPSENSIAGKQPLWK